MLKSLTLVAAALLSLSAPAAMAQPANMSFFVTSAGSGKGADLGGLAGADALCQQLATAAGAGDCCQRWPDRRAADQRPRGC